MTLARKKSSPAINPPPDWLDEALECLLQDKAVRKDFGADERLHIDRPLPFLAVHITEGAGGSAARDVAAAHASYLIAHDEKTARSIIGSLGPLLEKRFGSFLLIDIGELERDFLVSDDAPFLPPFEIRIAEQGGAAATKAADAMAGGVDIKSVKFRTPQVERGKLDGDFLAAPVARKAGFASVAVRFAPIYRQPMSQTIFPDLRERLVANIFDACLKACAAFVETSGGQKLTTHRALGRKAFVDAVSRADRSMDDVASSFDFLLAVTPINAAAAWHAFQAAKFREPPLFLYRPLTLQVEAEKRKLFSIAFDRFEDPVLHQLYREKQQELDLQLSMISARETARFVEYGRALYGPVERPLLKAATDLLAQTAKHAGEDDDPSGDIPYDWQEIVAAAEAMIAAYRQVYAGFEATVEVRDDLPSGLLVSSGKLLVARGTLIAANRLEALLSHEVGVHLLTYVNGSAQGLRLFRSGLAGYEGMQEGLAVFSEYMVGGMTPARLRLIAARVVACASMLSGADFIETFNLLVRDHGFRPAGAFHLTLRIYRGGGLAKDAIYLRGLLELLAHLEAGGALDPFWMGKIAASHFRVMQELGLRGLLKVPAVRPAFLKAHGAQARLDNARAGLSPLVMITS
ncbi:uncharacterized protein (TIGR02421 family) [Pararhizobium capsulatum DSM 1112]|uniref:Uncharacterized protein (TIGR02421 family) n=1 Tax=Pararhizobium capsulatum DSM 1112 TaxID=1121113 RepID=A0ABU0BWC1_9HYPH|nr:flavohemoglobin expression-modulating QEGLA motif protein [Pararhizobium capsulatum]MDQ0322563.1 uncharacterized protein (TIGR02421 family) [Pararhizobium capsulatum DSM 1112]